MSVFEPVADGIRSLDLRSPTLPPATHTRCWVVGHRAFTVFDPASPWSDEQERLDEAFLAAGVPVERIVLTHHHPDHVGGAVALRDVLAARGQQVPIVAHAETARLLAGDIDVDEQIADGAQLSCGGVTLDAWHTPGHAAGHLVFHDRASGAVVAGDLVAGVGTILIDPWEGDLGLYLASLERTQALGARALLPAHGPVLEHADAVLGFYVAHRHQRTAAIVAALDHLGETTADVVAKVVYGSELPEVMIPVAAIQVSAHLVWLRQHGRADGELGGTWRRVA